MAALRQKAVKLHLERSSDMEAKVLEHRTIFTTSILQFMPAMITAIALAMVVVRRHLEEYPFSKMYTAP